MEFSENNFDFSANKKQVRFLDSEEKIVSFKPNHVDEPVVIIGKTTKSGNDSMTYHSKKSMSYENYLIHKYKKHCKMSK